MSLSRINLKKIYATYSLTAIESYFILIYFSSFSAYACDSAQRWSIQKWVPRVGSRTHTHTRTNSTLLMSRAAFSTELFSICHNWIFIFLFCFFFCVFPFIFFLFSSSHTRSHEQGFIQAKKKYFYDLMRRFAEYLHAGDTNEFSIWHVVCRALNCRYSRRQNNELLLHMKIICVSISLPFYPSISLPSPPPFSLSLSHILTHTHFTKPEREEW